MKKFSETAISSGEPALNLNPMDPVIGLEMDRPKLLLHSCCGPCSTAVIERLIEDYDITVFFYNPNITDEAEYQMRLDAQKTVIEYFNSDRFIAYDRVKLVIGDYMPDDFLACAQGFEKEPEGGLRCNQCFRLRLDETARKAKEGEYDYFGTTLTVSPHKNYRLISEIGNGIGIEYDISFLDMDFKKKAGFQRSIELSKELGLYRQNYCGCGFSKWFED